MSRAAQLEAYALWIHRRLRLRQAQFGGAQMLLAPSTPSWAPADSGIASRASYTFDTTNHPSLVNTLAGSSLYVRLYCSGGTAPGTTAVTDIPGNGWSKVANNTSGSGDRYTELWKVDDAAAIVWTTTAGVTCTNATTTNVGWVLYEIQNTAGYDTSTATQAAANLTPGVAAQLTPAGASEWIESAVHNNTNTAAELSLASGGAGYTVTSAVETNGNAAISTSQAAGVATGPTWQAGGAATAQAWAMSIIAFKPLPQNNVYLGTISTS